MTARAAAPAHVDKVTATPGACMTHEECIRATKHESALKVRSAQRFSLLSQFLSLLTSRPWRG